jgi:iron complex transport system substrate-binding protein
MNPRSGPCIDRRRRVALRAFGAAALAAIPSLRAAPAAPLRVVSVGGSLTEIVYALGADALLVGTDATSLHPPAAHKTPKVGYLRGLSAEGVLSLRPTVVIASAEAGPPAALEQLRGAGVRLVRVESGHGIEALLANVRTVASAVDRRQPGELLAATLRAQWDEVQRRVVRDARAPRVLFVLGHAANNVQVSGHGTAAHALIAAAGGVNALSGFNGYRPLTAEAVVAAAPQAIVTTAQGVERLGGQSQLLALPGLALTPAGRAGRVFARDALYLLGTGPRLPEATAELARFLGTLT